MEDRESRKKDQGCVWDGIGKMKSQGRDSGGGWLMGKGGPELDLEGEREGRRGERGRGSQEERRPEIDTPNEEMSRDEEKRERK